MSTIDEVLKEARAGRPGFPSPAEIAIDPVPNRSPLTWAGVDAGSWAVSFRREDLQAAAEAFDKLEIDLGDVEDRFIHLRPDGQASITMIVLREETEGREAPDISSFAELRELRVRLAKRSAPLAAINERARRLWAA